MSNDVFSTAVPIHAVITQIKPNTAKLTVNAFTADLLAYEGIQVNLLLGRGMTAKNAIKSLYSATFHSRLGTTAPVRQLAARLAECLNLEMLTYTVLTADGGRVRATDTVATLRRITGVPTTVS